MTGRGSSALQLEIAFTRKWSISGHLYSLWGSWPTLWLLGVPFATLREGNMQCVVCNGEIPPTMDYEQ